MTSVITNNGLNDVGGAASKTDALTQSDDVEHNNGHEGKPGNDPTSGSPPTSTDCGGHMNCERDDVPIVHHGDDSSSQTRARGVSETSAACDGDDHGNESLGDDAKKDAAVATDMIQNESPKTRQKEPAIVAPKIASTVSGKDAVSPRKKKPRGWIEAENPDEGSYSTRKFVGKSKNRATCSSAASILNVILNMAERGCIIKLGQLVNFAWKELKSRQEKGAWTEKRVSKPKSNFDMFEYRNDECKKEYKSTYELVADVINDILQDDEFLPLFSADEKFEGVFFGNEDDIKSILKQVQKGLQANASEMQKYGLAPLGDITLSDLSKDYWETPAERGGRQQEHTNAEAAGRSQGGQSSNPKASAAKPAPSRARKPAKSRVPVKESTNKSNSKRKNPHDGEQVARKKSKGNKKSNSVMARALLKAASGFKNIGEALQILAKEIKLRE